MAWLLLSMLGVDRPSQVFPLPQDGTVTLHCQLIPWQSAAIDQGCLDQQGRYD
jgi:hypothetical protein